MFKLEDYFQLMGFPFAALFDGVERVWEVLTRIGAFIDGFGAFAIEGKISPHAIVETDRLALGKGSVVEPGAYIQGSAVIGADCVVRQGAYLRGNVVVGDGCIVGHTTEVKNSVFLNGAKAAHFAYVGDSALGAGVNLGAGTKLANFKLDAGGREVTVRGIDGESISTGLRKMGAILGDGVELGCNTVTAPGTLIGPGTACYPCMNLRGFYPGGRILKPADQNTLQIPKY